MSGKTAVRLRGCAASAGQPSLPFGWANSAEACGD